MYQKLIQINKNVKSYMQEVIQNMKKTMNDRRNVPKINLNK